MNQGLEATATDTRPAGSGPIASRSSWQSQLTRRLAHGVSIYVVGLVVGKGLTVALQIVLGRWLGPASYGSYALGYSIVALVQWLASLGLDQGVLRFCSLYRTQNQPGQVRATLQRALAAASVMSLLVAGVLAGSSSRIALRFFTPAFASVLELFVVALPFLIVTRIAATYVQSCNDIYRMTVLQNVAQPTMNLILLAIAIALGFRLKGAVGVYLLCSIGAMVLAIYYLVQRMPAPPSAPIETNHSPLMRYSMALESLAGLNDPI